MQCAIIGQGKTGGELVSILKKTDELSGVFDSKTPLKAEALMKADCAIVFVPGSAVQEVMETLLEIEIPVIWGSTGFIWPENIHKELVSRKRIWLHGSNFSMGMGIIRHLLRQLGPLCDLLQDASLHIHETHHIAKEDCPSGTALTWQECLGRESTISSARQGDIVGEHTLTIAASGEKISLEHQATSRRVFAEGAIWAARQIIEQTLTEPGFHTFDRLMNQQIEGICHETNTYMDSINHTIK